ncbi:MAG TPA: hypothetical protein VH351_19375 [Bryobacteraceae bacterium]|jgi:hypothetical protein|nr:hypothetical protein [Bryobacteraceae bacterium]
MARLIFYFCLLGVMTRGLAQAEDQQHVGSKTCFACHSSIYRSFLKTDMGRSMTLAGDLPNDGIPASAKIPAPDGKRVFEVAHDETGWTQTETQEGVFRNEQKLAYVVGSGANGRTFLVRRGNYLLQAPLSFYSNTGKWDLSPGFEGADLGFNRPIAAQCIWCHSGRPQPVTNHSGEFLEPPFQELAIGCESCHGPGGLHVRTAGKKVGAIVNPGKLPPRLAENICINCHQTGDTRVLQPGKGYQDFRPGQWLINTIAILKIPSKTDEQRASDLLQHNSAMQASRCFRESGGKLSCMTCHDPHTQPRGAESAETFRGKCLQCHTVQSCRAPLAVRKASEPPDNCIACHMPKRSVKEVSHSALTNHRIPARAGEPAPVQNENKMGDLVLVNQPTGPPVPLPDLTLLRAYGELAERAPEYQDLYAKLLDRLSKTASGEPVVQEALGHKALTEANYEEAVTHLTAALPLNEAIVYTDLSAALSHLGRLSEATEYLKKAAEIEPFNAVTQKTLILNYVNLKRYSEAREAMVSYVDRFPADDFMRNMLARVSK